MKDTDTPRGVARLLRRDADRLASGMVTPDLPALLRDYADLLDAALDRDAEAVLAACRLAHEDGDDTLCAEIDCPWRGEPNGCNHPTGYREVESPTSLAPTGNAAAMREALEQIRNDLWDLMGTSSESARSNMACDMSRKISAALSEPARNCDVGTADEQADRFKAFCYANRTPDNECSKECPFNDTSAVCYCQARWAQMSYEKKEENSNG